MLLQGIIFLCDFFCLVLVLFYHIDHLLTVLETPSFTLMTHAHLGY